MYILGFDTSNAYSSVAISKGSEIIYAKKDYDPNTQAERLILLIEEALNATSLNYEKLDYLSVCAGPGSFTGIRIALSAAKGILLACKKIKPICINNFETINFRIRQQILEYDFAVTTVNAFREELYLQIFSKKEKESEALQLSIQESVKLIESKIGKIVVAGSGVEKIYNFSEKFKESGNHTFLPRFAYPDARFICRVAHQQIMQNKENNIISPLYIRPPDAKLPTIK
jgi:tRNA threonylcarbamoyladenosine biosynthesis protein TsaB